MHIFQKTKMKIRKYNCYINIFHKFTIEKIVTVKEYFTLQLSIKTFKKKKGNVKCPSGYKFPCIFINFNEYNFEENINKIRHALGACS